MPLKPKFNEVRLRIWGDKARCWAPIGPMLLWLKCNEVRFFILRDKARWWAPSWPIALKSKSNEVRLLILRDSARCWAPIGPMWVLLKSNEVRLLIYSEVARCWAPKSRMSLFLKSNEVRFFIWGEVARFWAPIGPMLLLLKSNEVRFFIWGEVARCWAPSGSMRLLIRKFKVFNCGIIEKKVWFISWSMRSVMPFFPKSRDSRFEKLKGFSLSLNKEAERKSQFKWEIFKSLHCECFWRKRSNISASVGWIVLIEKEKFFLTRESRTIFEAKWHVSLIFLRAWGERSSVIRFQLSSFSKNVWNGAATGVDGASGSSMA